MEKETLQIKIKPRKQPKTKFGHWWEDEISYPFYIFKLKFKAWFFGGLYNLMLALIPKEKREKIKQEDSEIMVEIVNESGDEKFTEYLKESLREEYDLKEDKDIDEAVKKAISDLKNEF